MRLKSIGSYLPSFLRNRQRDQEDQLTPVDNSHLDAAQFNFFFGMYTTVLCRSVSSEPKKEVGIRKSYWNRRKHPMNAEWGPLSSRLPNFLAFVQPQSKEGPAFPHPTEDGGGADFGTVSSA